jgi:anti-anti-sigma factor
MPDAEYRFVKVTQHDDVLVLTPLITKMHEDAPAELLRLEMIRALEAAKTHKIVFDLGQVDFITTIGFQPLLSLRRRVQMAGGRAAVCGLSAAVHDVFEVTRLIPPQPGLPAVFEAASDVESAIKMLRS